jgi:membrane protein implicated in regulation of membrane protease activity
MDLTTLSPWLFGAVLVIGVGYLLVSIFAGGLDVDVHFDALDGGEAAGIGCNIIAAFCAGMGGVGLIGALSGWNLLLTLMLSLLAGLLIGRAIQRSLQFVMRGQSSDLLTDDRLIGREARVTINVPAGQIGEVMVEEPERMKYPVRHIDASPLQKGDLVTIEGIQAGRLLVRKIQVLNDAS